MSRMRVLVYSDDVEPRRVMLAVGSGRTPTCPGRVRRVRHRAGRDRDLDEGGIDLAILDGEAAPAGGMGIARQLKDEIYQCPPILVLIGRPEDGWLATWSRAEAAVPHPIDPLELAETVIAGCCARAPSCSSS